MSWTDERVEMLQQMWSEGQSAAQIAKTLGGVTRNAVIGKVHRLGLSNRAPTGARAAADAPAPEMLKTETPKAETPRAEASKGESVKPAAAPEPPAARVETPAPETAAEAADEAIIEEEQEEEVAGAAAPAPRAPSRDPLRREPAPMTEERLEVLANLAEIEKTARRVTLMDLTERVCKWPIGDPTDPAFRFCGLPAQQGKPYCEAHVAVAFQPMSSRRDRDRQRIRN